ncbi:MAG TPA: phosphoribosyltransferase family protein [Yeosuana sp.]
MEVITLNKELFSEKCSELICKMDFHPDFVVGILSGGGYVIDEIVNEVGFDSVQFELVRLHRRNKFKSNFIIKSILKLLPYKFTNKLRIFESKKARSSIAELNLTKVFSNNIDFKLNSDSIETVKNILILDDAIDTGRTMFIVKNSLGKLFPKSQIKTAVISWTIENSIIKPDYYLYKNILVRFPWSIDYKGKDFEKKSISS